MKAGQAPLPVNPLSVCPFLSKLPFSAATWCCPPARQYTPVLPHLRVALLLGVGQPEGSVELYFQRLALAVPHVPAHGGCTSEAVARSDHLRRAPCRAPLHRQNASDAASTHASLPAASAPCQPCPPSHPPVQHVKLGAGHRVDHFRLDVCHREPVASGVQQHAAVWEPGPVVDCRGGGGGGTGTGWQQLLAASGRSLRRAGRCHEGSTAWPAGCRFGDMGRQAGGDAHAPGNTLIPRLSIHSHC